jgi:RimJ/RimL family protein N-acetyltransferase
MKQPSIFESDHLHLAAVDLDQDPNVMSGWTYDLDIARVFNGLAPHPLAAFEVKKYCANRQKDGQENGKVFLFSIRARQEDRLVGLLDIGHVMWNHGNTGFKLVFGEPDDRNQFAAEGLQLALQFIFDELNLYRAMLLLPEYDQTGIDLAEQAGFILEVRMRQADYRNGQTWNRLIYGLLRQEYEKRQVAEVAA